MCIHNIFYTFVCLIKNIEYAELNIKQNAYLLEITINDVMVKAQDELTCGLGECVSVGVGVCNALEHQLNDLALSINFYQDHHNGVNNYQLETRLSIAGANKVMLPAVSYNFYECNLYGCVCVYIYICSLLSQINDDSCRSMAERIMNAGWYFSQLVSTK